MRCIILSLLLLAATGLTGCATPREQAAAEWQQAVEFCDAAFRDSAIDPIRAKLPPPIGTGPSLEAMADTTHATDEQRPAIVALDRAAVDCANKRAVHAAKYGGSDYAAVVHAGAVDAQRNRLALYQGAITWGQYRQGVEKINQDIRSTFAVLDQRNREVAMRERAANARAAAELTHASAALMQAGRPFTLQPFVPLAPTVNCVSNQSGTMTTTTCR